MRPSLLMSRPIPVGRPVVRAPIHRLDPVMGHKRQGRLDDLAGMIRLLGRLDLLGWWTYDCLPVTGGGKKAPEDRTGHYTRLNLLNMYFNMYYPQPEPTEGLV